MNRQQEKMAAAASAGFSAIMYVTDPQRWPGFAAFAEQQAGQTWNEADRLSMRADGALLWALCGALEAL